MEEQQLREVIATLRAEADAKDQRIAALEDRVTGLEAELDAAHEENRRLTKECERLQSESAVDAQELRERYEEERRELTEEMKAAWTFESNELRREVEGWRAEAERLKGVEARLAEHVVTLIELLPYGEGDIRASIEREEETARTALPLSVDGMGKKFIDSFLDTKNFREVGEGLFRLYEEVVSGDVPVPAVRQMLAKRRQFTELNFNTRGQKETLRAANAFDIPPQDIVPFLCNVVCQLPRLRYLGLRCLPSMSESVVPVAGCLPVTITEVTVDYTPYSVADLIEIVSRCRWLKRLWVDYDCCTDWGKFGSFVDKEKKKKAVDKLCSGVICWN